MPKRLSGWHEGISAQWGGGRPPTSHHMSPSPTHHSVLSMRIEACVPQPLCLLSPRSPASPMALRPRFSHHRMKRLHQSEFPVPLLRPTSLGSHLPDPYTQFPLSRLGQPLHPGLQLPVRPRRPAPPDNCVCSGLVCKRHPANTYLFTCSHEGSQETPTCRCAHGSPGETWLWP